jgi:arylsulfatase A-like enzyme
MPSIDSAVRRRYSSPNMSAKPNIVFIYTDDQRFDTIAALGNPQISTPNLDRLAARGAAFSHAHIMGGSHGAVCMPSRAMAHTGRSLYHIEREGQAIAADQVMLGEHLQRCGYHTWGCGKWHNGQEAFNRSFADGDVIFFGGMADHWNVPTFRYDPTGAYAARTPRCVDAFKTNELQWLPGDLHRPGVHSSERLADAAVNFLQNYDGDQPFYMYIATLAPHDPRTMPQHFLDLYDPADIELPENFMAAHPFDNGDLHGRDEKLAAFPRSADEVRRHIAEYYAMITHLDDELGRVFDALEQTGRLDNTLIAFAGDNGLAIGQHGLMGKQNLYDHSVRVPLMFAGPGVPRGQQCDNLCYVIDIYPTLCDLAGLDTPASVDGRSLARVLRGEIDTTRDVLHLAYQRFIRAATDGRHKLISYHVHDQRRTQLFDLQADPRETHNLADDPTVADVRRRLTDELNVWRTQLDDDRPRQGADFWAV